MREILFKRSGKLTLILAIIHTFTSFVYSLGLFFILAAVIPSIKALIDWEALEVDPNEVQGVGYFEMFAILILLVVSVIVCVSLYRSRATLRQKKIVSRWPYLGAMTIQVYLIGEQVVGQTLDFLSVVTNGGVILLTILSMVNLSRLKSFDLDDM